MTAKIKMYRPYNKKMLIDIDKAVRSFCDVNNLPISNSVARVFHKRNNGFHADRPQDIYIPSSKKIKYFYLEYNIGEGEAYLYIMETELIINGDFDSEMINAIYKTVKNVVDLHNLMGNKYMDRKKFAWRIFEILIGVAAIVGTIFAIMSYYK